MNPSFFKPLRTVAGRFTMGAPTLVLFLAAGCSRCKGENTCFEMNELAEKHLLALEVPPPIQEPATCSPGGPGGASSQDIPQAGASGLAEESLTSEEDESCEDALARNESLLAQYYEAHSAVLSWKPEHGCPTVQQMQAIHDLTSEESRWFEEPEDTSGETCCYKSGLFCD